MGTTLSDRLSFRTEKEPVDINIWLDTYDEMFSDFDPRPFSKRTISDDFILQVRNVSKDRCHDLMSLNLLIPKNLREPKTESVLAERLQAYFKTSYEQLLTEKKKHISKGLMMIALGIIIMIATTAMSYLKPETFFNHLLTMLSEPAEWILIWMGFDHLIYLSNKDKKERTFFRYLSKSKIGFCDYE